MDTDQKFDVVVAGGGITGLSAAYHVERQVNARVALAMKPTPPSATLASAGLLGGGWYDNFTRISHAYGATAAAEAWRFGDAAFAAVTAYVKTAKLALDKGSRLRIAASDMEVREIELAVAGLNAAGFPSRMLRGPEMRTAWPELGPRALAVQDDGQAGARLAPDALLQSLAKGVTAPRIADVVAWEKRGSGLAVKLSDGRTVETEILIVATHLAIPELVPDLHDAIIAVADQWHELEVSNAPQPWSEPGLVFSINHGYEWGVTCGGGRIALGGARYVRKMAGIEAPAASVEEPVTRALLAGFAKTFAWGVGARVISTQASRDCRPCDELPIIGPMYGEGRILVATGYMGLGLTQGFFAGACLAELIASGRCDALPRRFWPERLRSLSS